MSAVYEVLTSADGREGTDRFARDLLAGLSAQPKSIPSKYFYDERGSRLFQRITQLEEYYLTRSEREILERHCDEIADAARGGPLRLVELGVGDGRKTEILLRHFVERRLQVQYVPVDICREPVIGLTDSLQRNLDCRWLEVHGLVADYFDAIRMLRGDRSLRNLVLFLGSSIGNFTHPAASQFLRLLRRSLNPGDRLLLGFDLEKDVGALTRAYNDSQGVTREFNLNLLDRINRELGGHFQRRKFRHYGFYNPGQGRMESWLVSTEAQSVRIAALDRTFFLDAWEGIHVEDSYKYSLAQIEGMAGDAGFSVRRHLFDRRRYFVDSLWEVRAEITG